MFSYNDHNNRYNSQSSGSGYPPTSCDRTFNSSGTVMRINDECGLVNNEIFFFLRVCQGKIPRLGDQVSFEATLSTTGKFKWNANHVELKHHQPHMPAVFGSGHQKSYFERNSFDWNSHAQNNRTSSAGQAPPSAPVLVRNQEREKNIFSKREKDKAKQARQWEKLKKYQNEEGTLTKKQLQQKHKNAQKAQKRKLKGATCGDCLKSFVTQQKYDKHMRKFKGNCQKFKQVEYRKCAVCYELLANKFALARHMMKNHRRDFPYVCGNCKAKFRYLEDLEKHVVEKVSKREQCHNEERIAEFHAFVNALKEKVNANQEERMLHRAEVKKAKQQQRQGTVGNDGEKDDDVEVGDVDDDDDKVDGDAESVDDDVDSVGDGGDNVDDDADVVEDADADGKDNLSN